MYKSRRRSLFVGTGRGETGLAGGLCRSSYIRGFVSRAGRSVTVLHTRLIDRASPRPGDIGCELLARLWASAGNVGRRKLFIVEVASTRTRLVVEGAAHRLRDWY